ncbi:MAG: YdeI/OmpD-associated family protein [Flavobacteriia bacterium]|nr:YdeI/OmpD-associated family protein [Flavobacteriia bacterium]
MNPQVNQYLEAGCGRCSRYNTPDCSVALWKDVMVELRRIVESSRLKEEYKWKHPCYTYKGKNVVLLGAFRDHGHINFINGVLLKDPAGILIQPTENSQAGRTIRFNDPKDVLEKEPAIRALIEEAIEVEESGKKVQYKKTEDFDVPEELNEKFKEFPEFKRAFEALTPGRQRSWLLHFGGAKQSKTRVSRIDKAVEKIFAGKGWNER